MAPRAKSQTELTARLESIALGAVRKQFSPEFVNRIDAVVTYNPLNAEAIEIILDHDFASGSHLNDDITSPRLTACNAKIMIENYFYRFGIKWL